MGAREAGDPVPETNVFGGLPEKADLGQILLRQGVIRPEQLEECLRLQRDLASQVQTPPPRLGELLVQKGYASREAIVRALREQSKKILYCTRCGILMNVDARPDAISYNCGRCQGPLVEPPAGSQDRCSDTQVIVNSRLPVPPEVLAARQDSARRFGKYVILEPLGRGGIAEVHRAWDTYLHQYVALKRIRTGATDGMDTRQSRIASLLNEAHNAIRLRHPNIVTVYDIGRVGNSFYISMEYLDGRTLFEEIRLCRESGRVSPYYEDPRRWLGVLFQAAHAVHYAHTRPVPIFHCDLKPGNIFVTREGRVCVLDFGLAHQVGEFRDEAGAIAGTPSYMAPEQIQGYPGGIDARTDVYGLGTILYELLAGQPPFTGEMADVLGKVLDEPPAPPGRVARQGRASRVPPPLEEFCLRCLEKDPARRPATALEFAQTLERLAGLGLEVPVGFDQPSSRFATVKETEPPPPPAPPRPRSLLRWGAIPGAALLLAAVLLWGLRGGGRGDLSAEAQGLLAAFQPEKALALDPSLRTRRQRGDLGDRLQAAELFKERLVRALNAFKPVLRDLDVGGRRLRDVKIWKAGGENVLFECGEVPDEISWKVLGPGGVAALAEACGLLEQPADRFGLAVYGAAAGAPDEARSLLETLRGTDFEDRARILLAALGRK